MEGFIDIHTHVLPGVDDGARDMEEACRMLEQAAAQGVTAVIATPHGFGGCSAQELKTLAEELQRRIRDRLPGLSIYLGQEHYYHEELLDSLACGLALTMAGSRSVLVEFSPAASYQMLYRGIRRLAAAGYQPVLAHMERYRCLREEHHLRELLEDGCLMQMNCDSIRGRIFDPDVRWCRRQIKAGRIHLLASDMHRMDCRPPELGEALRWLEKNVSGADLDRMARQNALHMINDEKIS